MVRGHQFGGEKVEGWSQTHNLNVFFVSFSNLTRICDLENEELQAETEDLLKEASVRHRAHTGLFKGPSSQGITKQAHGCSPHIRAEHGITLVVASSVFVQFSSHLQCVAT